MLDCKRFILYITNTKILTVNHLSKQLEQVKLQLEDVVQRTQKLNSLLPEDHRLPPISFIPQIPPREMESHSHEAACPHRYPVSGSAAEQVSLIFALHLQTYPTANLLEEVH
jgi:hypothetical protein